MALSSWLRGPRVRAVTFSVTTITALGLVFATSGQQCNSDEEDPVAAVQAFVVLARAGDRDGMYQRLGPRTRASLDQAAARASQLVSSKDYRGKDMVHAAGLELQNPRYEVHSQTADRARVLAIDDSGHSTLIELVREGSRWQLELAPSP